MPNINPSLMKTQLYDAFRYDALSAIVTEATVRALPLNRQSLGKYVPDLRGCIRSAMENMDGLAMLDHALENADAIPKKAFLYNLKDAIETTAAEAASRVAMENTYSDNLKDVVGKRGFTQQELSRLQAKAKDITVPQLSKVINKKVTDVLKDELRSYEEEMALKQELKETLQKQTDEMNERLGLTGMNEDDETKPSAAESPEEENLPSEANSLPEQSGEDEDEDDSAVESFMNLVLSKGDVRNHVSVFSRLQDLAMEELANGYHKIRGEMPAPVLEAMIGNSLFAIEKKPTSVEEDLERLEVATESITASADGQLLDSNRNMNIAHVCAITVYTLLETLKTMNLYSPDITSIKNFVDSSPSAGALPDMVDSLQKKMMDQIGMIRNKIPLMSSAQLGIAYDSCNNMKTHIEKLSPKFPDLKNTVLPGLENVMGQLMDKIQKQYKEPVQESAFVSRQRQDNIAAFDALARTMGKRPDVREIRIMLDPASEASYVEVCSCGPNGLPSTPTSVLINRHPQLGSMQDIVTESLNASKLKHCQKNVRIYNTATCKFVNY